MTNEAKFYIRKYGCFLNFKIDYKTAHGIPITSKVRACVDFKEFLEIINKHWHINPIKVRMPEGRIVQYRTFAVANWFWNKTENFSIWIDVLNLVGFSKAV